MRPLYRTLLIIGVLLILVGFFMSIGAFFGGATFSLLPFSFQSDYTPAPENSSQGSGEWTDEDQENVMNDIIVYDTNSSITSIDISLSMAEVVIEKGSVFEIETRDIPKHEIQSTVSSDGKLRVTNKTSHTFSTIFGSRWINRHPKVIITLPGPLHLSYVSIEIGAGSFSSHEIEINAEKARIEVGAGELIIKNLHTLKLTAKCGMGSLVLSGRMQGQTYLECGMGSISASIDGDRESYSYNADVGLGNVKVNSEEITGFGNTRAGKKRDNHIDIECGMGDVKIQIQ